MTDLDAATVGERLGLGEPHARWLQALEAVGPPPWPVRLPPAEAAAALLRRLTVAEADAADVTSSLPSAAAQPELWWLLERSHHWMTRHMGDHDAALDWPPLPPHLGAQGRLFLVYLFLAVFDDVRAWHREHQVPEAASWGTFSGLGRAMAIHRELHGVAGVFAHGWMTLPFRACLYELGRLQYTPFRIATGHAGPSDWYGEETARRLGPGFRPGDSTVGIHIPASGPLTPESVDRSLRWARELFSRPLPFGPCRIAICGSWLLDEQWAEYLPPTSNIVQFQRRFTMLPGAGDADASIFRHVLRRPPTDNLDELPRRTTLERAIVEHWRKGRHWRSRTGWLEL